jgi:N6-adenosine-specific RNA methylase IME4
MNDKPENQVMPLGPKTSDITPQKLSNALVGLSDRLSGANTPDEIARIENAAGALKELAKRAHLSRDQQNQAGNITLDCARKGGQVLEGMSERGERAGRGQPKKVTGHDVPLLPTLVDLGLAGNPVAARARAKRWELIRQLPEHLYSQFKQDIIEQNNDAVLTVAGAIAYVRKWKRERDLAEQRAAIAKGEFTVGVGPYDVIVCDPPWPYGTQYNAEGRRAANPYPEMSLEEIGADGDREIAAKAAPDCILWLWTTHKFMRHSFPLLDRWGFADKQIVTWEKQKIGLGSWLRSKSEFCIMAMRGSPTVHLTNQSTMIHGPAREHSRKPDEFYDMVESLCLGVRRYDRFTREPRPAWDGGGNQPDKFL